MKKSTNGTLVPKDGTVIAIFMALLFTASLTMGIYAGNTARSRSSEIEDDPGKDSRTNGTVLGRDGRLENSVLAGYVYNIEDKSALANHTVTVTGYRFIGNSTGTDASGWYSIYVPRGQLRIRVENQDSIEVFRTGVNMSRNGRIRMDLGIDPDKMVNSRLFGRVTGEDGKGAVEDAVIKIEPVSHSAPSVRSTADVKGEYEHYLTSGTYLVEFEYAGEVLNTREVTLHWGETRGLNASLDVRPAGDGDGNWVSHFGRRVKEKWYYVLAMGIILVMGVVIMHSVSYAVKRSKLLRKSFPSNISINIFLRTEKVLVILSVMLGEVYLAGYYFRSIHRYVWTNISPYLYNVFFMIVIYYLIKLLRSMITDYVMHIRKKEQKLGGPEKPKGKTTLKNFLKMPAYQIEQVAPVLNYMILVVGILVITSTILATVGKQESIFGSVTGFFADNSNYFYFIAITILVVWLLRRMVNIIFTNMSFRTKKVNPAVVRLAGKGLNIFIIGFSVMVILVAILQMADLGEISSVILSVAIVSIGVASAIASTGGINNLITGMAVQAFRPIDLGDRIKFGDRLVGDVVEFSNVNVKVRNLEGEYVTIPHNKVLQHTMVNLTQSVPVALTIGATIGYDVPHEDVECLMLDSATKTNGVLSDPEPETVLVEMRDYYIRYELKAYIEDVKNLREIKSELIRKCHTLFYERGVEILSPAYHVLRREEAPDKDIMKGYVDSKLSNLVEVCRSGVTMVREPAGEGKDRAKTKKTRRRRRKKRKKKTKE